MSAPPDEATKPDQPTLGELFELSLTAIVNAPGVFARLAARPAPGPGACFLVALSWGALFFALNLIHLSISSSASVQAYASWQIAAAAVLALGAWSALYMLLASCVYGLGRALGSEGDFERALLVASVTLAAAPAQALCTWVPMAWALPAIIAAWTLACGLHALFKAEAWAARGACAALAAGVLSLQYGAGLVVEKYSAAARLAAAAVEAAPSASQLADLQRQMQQAQTIADQATLNAQAGASSLDLLRGPGIDPAPAAGPTPMQQLAQMNAQGDAMNKSMAGMLDAIEPMLNNPMITQNMTPQQKSDYAELKRMMRDFKTSLAANTLPSHQEQQARLMQIQGLVMRMVSAGMAGPKANPPGAAK